MQKKGERNVLAKAKTDRRGAGGRRAVRPTGSAILADRASATAPRPGVEYADFVRQRKDDIARDIRAGRERAACIAEGIADARIRRDFLVAEAQHERAIEDFWRRFFRRMRKPKDGIARHVGGKGGGSRASGRSDGLSHGSQPARSALPTGAQQLASYSGPVLDRRGCRGVYLSASYLSAKRASFGCARRLVRYATDPAHVEQDEHGNALMGSNVGKTRTEMSAAFSVVEHLNRAARANAKVVFHLIVQLPFDVTPAQRAEILREWCEDAFGARNLPYVWAVHTPDADGDQRNTHGHVAVSFRPLVRVAPFTWDAGREVKAELDNPEAFRLLRERFATTMTEVCDRAGKNRTYTALSYAARGLKLAPTTHLGAHKTRLVREGTYVAAHARNARTIQHNEALIELERLKHRQRTLGKRFETVHAIAGRTVSRTRTAARASRTSPAPKVYGIRQRKHLPSSPSVERVAISHPTAPTVHAGDIAVSSDRLVRTRTGRNTVHAERASVATVVNAKPKPFVSEPITAPSSAPRGIETKRVSVDAVTPRANVGANISARLVRQPTRSQERLQAQVYSPISVPFAAKSTRTPAEHHRIDAISTAVRPSAQATRMVVPSSSARVMPSESSINTRATAAAAALRPNTPDGLALGMPFPARLPVAATRAIITWPRTSDRPEARSDHDTVLAAFDAAHLQLRRDHIARAKAKLRDAERQRARKAAATAAAARAEQARIDAEDSFLSFDDVAVADQADAFGDLSSFDTIGSFGALDSEVASDAVKPLSQAPTPPPATAVPSAPVAIPDGFGGMRETPPPIFRAAPLDLQLAAFDPNTGEPARALLALLRSAGCHPHLLDFADDGRLMALPGTPKAIDPLVRMWRNNDAVETLLVAIVSASRAAGKPVWPDHLAARIRALDPPVAPQRGSLRDRTDGFTR